jgi:hypothetical protein
MKQIKQYLLGLVGGVLLALGTANAQEARLNSIESMNVVQQGSVLNVKLTFKEPCRLFRQRSALPSRRASPLTFRIRPMASASRARRTTRETEERQYCPGRGPHPCGPEPEQGHDLRGDH